MAGADSFDEMNSELQSKLSECLCPVSKLSVVQITSGLAVSVAKGSVSCLLEMELDACRFLPRGFYGGEK